MKVIKIDDVDPVVKDKVSTAKISLSTKPEYTFFTSALLRLNLVYVDSGTLATDGLRLFVNPNFVAPLTNRQIGFGLMHEVFHVIYNHIGRLGNKDHATWNQATDFVINNQLDNMGLDVIDGICLDHQYDNMTADEIYAKLIKNPNNNPQSSFDDLVPTPMGGQDSQGNGMQVPTPDQVAQHAQDMINQGMIAAQMEGDKAVGNIPAEIVRDYMERMNPLINWKDALSDFLFASGKQGKSYKKPSRRGRAMGISLPGKAGKGLGRIDFSIDTSGSVSEDMFNQFISEISYVFEKMKPKEIGISQFDHELKSRDVIRNANEFKDVKFVGGGGTQIEPVMRMFKEVDSKALIVLTDGYFYHSQDMNPNKPVVWCIYDNPRWQPPFGTAIHFKL